MSSGEFFVKIQMVNEGNGQQRIVQSDNEALTMSVPKSMHRMVTVPRGRGTSARMKTKKGEISGMFEVSV